MRLEIGLGKFTVRVIHKSKAGLFTQRLHYSPVFPRLTKHYLGIHLNDELVGVLTLGWGTQPKGTIKKLFPSLDTIDYLEIGKMCMTEEMPRNSETQMLKEVVKWIKKNRPDVSLLYTMADGIMGKPGYVYQAFNFWYGGSYWTDSFMTNTGEKVHPRSMKGVLKDNADWLRETTEWDKEKLFWPTVDYINKIGMRRIKGLMFRYMYPLNNKGKRLLKNNIEWQLNSGYPKITDLKWKEQTTNGYVEIEQPEFNFDNAVINKKNIEQFKQYESLEKWFG